MEKIIINLWNTNDLLELECMIFDRRDLFHKNTDPFDVACKHKMMDLFNWLINYICPKIKGYKYKFSRKHIFNSICKHGLIEMAKEYVIHNEFESDDINDAFLSASSNGQLHIIKWLYFNYDIIIDYCYDRDMFDTSYTPFILACKNNHIGVAKWLFQKGVKIHLFSDAAMDFACRRSNFKIMEWLFTIDKNYDLQCEHYSIDVLKWLHIRGFKLINKKNSILKRACFTNNLKKFKFMHSIGAKIRDDDFITVYRNGSHDVLKWIVSNGLKTHMIYDAFIWMCGAGNLKMINWFISNGLEIRDNAPFIQACRSNKSEVIQWFIDNYEMDSDTMNIAFELCCKNGNLEMAQLIYSKGNVKIDETVFGYKTMQNIKLVHWLLSFGLNKEKIDCHGIYGTLTSSEADGKNQLIQHIYMFFH